ncbi:hypothetical protein TNCV_1115191 [Trichonephila clavipes]|nr:hypothetical protein TNCV_1115191 [Trichonephila clavipes]
MFAADIHRPITEVYGTEAMSDSKVRKSARKIKDERINVHDEENLGRPSVITDDLIQAVKTKIPQNYICQQCTRTGVVFCWWTSCHKEQGSTQVPTVQLYGSSEEHCKTNGASCCKKVFCSSAVMQGLTLLERLDLIESFGWEVLDHVPCNPYLAPSDFNLFWYLKHSLGGKRFSDNEEVKAAVN